MNACWKKYFVCFKISKFCMPFLSFLICVCPNFDLFAWCAVHFVLFGKCLSTCTFPILLCVLLLAFLLGVWVLFSLHVVPFCVSCCRQTHECWLLVLSRLVQCQFGVVFWGFWLVIRDNQSVFTWPGVAIGLTNFVQFLWYFRIYFHKIFYSGLVLK